MNEEQQDQGDKLDALLRDAAREYHAPPETPKAELWERIRAVRESKGVLPFRRRVRLSARPTVRLWLGIAALVVLGIAIGRITAPGRPAIPAPTPATASNGSAPQEHGELAAQLAAVQHFGQVETFLTEFATRQAAQDFQLKAKDLLSTTRLLLDSKRLTDVRTRALLEDLELILSQIASSDSNDREDRDFISDGLAQNQLRTRLRNAIPAGPAIRM